MYWEASAPSNLALIKYAGKKTDTNIPLNASLSYTLNSFITYVRITPIEESKDRLEVFKGEEYLPLVLPPLAVNRFLTFFKFLKKSFHVSGSYLIESANNFPVSAGAASSASSFCALTKATYKMALVNSTSIKDIQNFTLKDLSILSRHGSGSSCRSFFSPWALWEQEGACSITLPFPFLIHQFIIADTKNKLVSSSAAHKILLTSSVLKGRVDRAQNRLSYLLLALNAQNWRECFEIIWDEFQDLHQLYETSNPPVIYRNKKTYDILNTVKNFWDKHKDGPLVTMDAGASVHLLYRPDQKKIASFLKNALL